MQQEASIKNTAKAPVKQGFFSRYETAIKNDWHKVEDEWKSHQKVDAVFDAVTVLQQSFVDAYAKPLAKSLVTDVKTGVGEVAHEALPVINKEVIIIGGVLILAGYVVVKGMHEANDTIGRLTNI